MKREDNRIYIQMFGEFSIQRGDRILDSESNRSKKVINLIEFLIANRNATVSQEKLIESVWDGEEFDNPLNTLKNMAYRARNVLKSLWAEDEQIVDLIKFEGNTYVWNNSVECVVDIEELERLSEEVEKGQLNKDERIVCLYKLFDLYKGEFLPKSSFYEWVIHLNAYYHSLFSKNTKLLLGLLREDGRYEDVASICEKYNRFYSYDEDVHVKLLEAYVKTARFKEAATHYQFIEELFFEEFGVGLS
ncbi:MAG: winged helix-turn-helix domain-containing protein, partial [Lachnospiraceae bacterium]|nr:winged helix-turn-helix domain-containing protein [Lachnospiraceae bacterium]